MGLLLMKTQGISFVAAIFVIAFTGKTLGYKHVVYMHGLLGAPKEFDYFKSQIQKVHPGTPVTSVDAFDELLSFTELWYQIGNITEIVGPILTNASSNGTVLICYSQGGVICRGLLATLKHNVDTFIAISSPLAGQYGDTKYLKFLFPNYVKGNIYKIFYTSLGQDISIANYWNDPHHQELYANFSNYLAILNNQSTTPSPKNREYRENFLRLKNVILVGGPDDGVITPWQSSQFAMYNSSEIVLPMELQEWYQNDAFGLRTLNERGGVHIHTYPGVEHQTWYKNPKVFKECVLPWLQ